MVHDAICELSGRSVIRDTLVPLHRKTRRYRKTAMQDKERAVHSLQEHHAILEGLQSGDPDKAKEAMDAHMKNAKAYMLGGI